jgi:hypothetical protein
MLIYENNFPATLQAICIGPDPAFLENNTTNCEFVSAFPHEVDLMYDWKNLKKSSEPMRSLRDFCKKLIKTAAYNYAYIFVILKIKLRK